MLGVVRETNSVWEIQWSVEYKVESDRSVSAFGHRSIRFVYRSW